MESTNRSTHWQWMKNKSTALSKPPGGYITPHSFVITLNDHCCKSYCNTTMWNNTWMVKRHNLMALLHQMENDVFISLWSAATKLNTFGSINRGLWPLCIYSMLCTCVFTKSVLTECYSWWSLPTPHSTYEGWQPRLRHSQTRLKGETLHTAMSQLQMITGAGAIVPRSEKGTLKSSSMKNYLSYCFILLNWKSSYIFLSGCS